MTRTMDGWMDGWLVSVTTGVPNCDPWGWAGELRGGRGRMSIIISIMVPGGRYHWL